MSEQTKVAVTITEMARLCGLSRARFYQLQKAGVFPPPLYDVSTRRPIYVEELQKVCLEVRRRNYGVNGKAVLFYARRHNQGSPIPKRPKAKIQEPKKGQHSDVLESLHALGLTSVTAAQVGAAIKELFPQGTSGMDQAEVIKALFLHLRRKDSGDSLGR
jgi:hypothetical protein